jgi:hypothetical protein
MGRASIQQPEIVTSWHSQRLAPWEQRTELTPAPVPQRNCGQDLCCPEGIFHCSKPDLAG